MSIILFIIYAGLFLLLFLYMEYLKKHSASKKK
jgi:hypothetical protein